MSLFPKKVENPFKLFFLHNKVSVKYVKLCTSSPYIIIRNRHKNGLLLWCFDYFIYFFSIQ